MDSGLQVWCVCVCQWCVCACVCVRVLDCDSHVAGASIHFSDWGGAKERKIKTNFFGTQKVAI